MTGDPTKARLLEEAGKEFADKGFERATIRDICERAGTNIAAVNYHFGGKQRLYEAAVLEAHECSKGRVDDAALPAAPEERLRTFIHEMLASILDNARRNPWQDALMLRELIQPSGAADTLVRESIGPRFAWLKATLRELAPGADERRLHALAFSVVGQCLHYKVARPISVRLVGEAAYESLDVDYLTDHISTLVLAAIAATDEVRAGG